LSILHAETFALLTELFGVVPSARRVASMYASVCSMRFGP
jgi:hypothetical protein